MPDRIAFITNPIDSGQVLLLDLSGFSSASESLSFISDARDVIHAQPQHSLHILVDVTGSKFNTEVVETLKEFANNNRPFVIASAVVGVSGLQRIIMDGVLAFTGRTNLKAFSDRSVAFEWLADRQ